MTEIESVSEAIAAAATDAGITLSREACDILAEAAVEDVHLWREMSSAPVEHPAYEELRQERARRVSDAARAEESESRAVRAMRDRIESRDRVIDALRDRIRDTSNR